MGLSVSRMSGVAWLVAAIPVLQRRAIGCRTPGVSVTRARTELCQEPARCGLLACRVSTDPAVSWLQPLVDAGDVYGGFVADSELVIPGRDCPVAFEPVDRALHGVAFAIVDGIELGRPGRHGNLA